MNLPLFLGGTYSTIALPELMDLQEFSIGEGPEKIDADKELVQVI